MEITTNILTKGCVVNCVFCPQGTLLNVYKGDKIMSLDNFKMALDKIPKEITIIFSGFSEPWLNKQCTEMVLYAYEKKHPISIFTTGIGMDIEDIDKIKHIPFSLGPKNPIIDINGKPVRNGGFSLHIPDNENYSKHPITEKYIALLEHIKKIKNSISNFEVISMGTVHEKIKHIFPTATVIKLWSRADNLLKEKDLKPELVALNNKYEMVYQGIKPMTCNCDEKLYHNVLLPNGDIVLCCMDYSLDNILGNLYAQEYNDILPELNTSFELCKFCENGTPIKK
jgi:organic radical activating enzyme